MKRTLVMFAIGAALGAGAGCSKSNQAICEDACAQGNACGVYLSTQDAGAGITIMATHTDCTAECANAGSAPPDGGASTTCKDEAGYDTCVNAVNTSSASCVTDLVACSSHC
jgi:hypothetical protein